MYFEIFQEIHRFVVFYGQDEKLDSLGLTFFVKYVCKPRDSKRVALGKSVCIPDEEPGLAISLKAPYFRKDSCIPRKNPGIFVCS